MAKTLLEVLQENKLELIESSNGRWLLNCPFHEGDREPSFTIYPNQTYYCFGCEVWGDAVKFLVEYKHMTQQQALEYVGIDYKFPKPTKTNVIKLKDTLETWKFLGEVTNIYHDYLRQTPGPVNYLYSRGLTDETIDEYKLGYTDGYVLNLKFAEDYKLGFEVGLINKSGYEMLSHRITIPNLLERGEVDFITGRTVVNNERKYLNTKGSKPIQGFFEIRKSPVIFLIEGQMDWLLLRQWGYPAAVMAGSHLTKTNQLLLETKQIVVVPDNDAVGKSVAEGIKNRFKDVTILDYERFGAKDISELTENRSDAQNLFNDLVMEQATWITSLSKETLNRFFPTLGKRIYSH